MLHDFEFFEKLMGAIMALREVRGRLMSAMKLLFERLDAT